MTVFFFFTVSHKGSISIVVKRIINAFSARVKLYHTLTISTLCYYDKTERQQKA